MNHSFPPAAENAMPLSARRSRNDYPALAQLAFGQISSAQPSSSAPSSARLSYQPSSFQVTVRPYSVSAPSSPATASGPSLLSSLQRLPSRQHTTVGDFSHGSSPSQAEASSAVIYSPQPEAVVYSPPAETVVYSPSPEAVVYTPPPSPVEKTAPAAVKPSPRFVLQSVPSSPGPVTPRMRGPGLQAAAKADDSPQPASPDSKLAAVPEATMRMSLRHNAQSPQPRFRSVLPQGGSVRAPVALQRSGSVQLQQPQGGGSLHAPAGFQRSGSVLLQPQGGSVRSPPGAPTRSASVMLRPGGGSNRSSAGPQRSASVMLQPHRAPASPPQSKGTAAAAAASSERPSEQRSAATCSTATDDRAMNSEQMETRTAQQDPSAALAALGRPSEEVADLVQVVSLGNSCATKLSIRRLGLDEATLPCDWIRSSMAGLLQWLRDDFKDFLSADQRYDLRMSDCSMTVYRSPTHSFWHDDISEASTKEKLQRRIDRFLNLDVDSKSSEKPRALLFVRSVANSAELSEVEALLELLKERFGRNGRRVCLLVVMDEQPSTVQVLHEEHKDSLFFCLQPLFSGRLSLDCSTLSPYEKAIAVAIRRLLNDNSESEADTCQSVKQAADMLQEDGIGAKAMDSGNWVGKVQLEGRAEDMLFAAFEGLDAASSGLAKNSAR